MNILEEIGSAKTVGIAGHIRPDGDCVGSCLGMYNYLKNACNDKEIFIFMEEPSPVFSYLKGFSDLNTSFTCDKEIEVFISLDASDLERLGDARKFFDNAKKTICIDHHISNKGFADVSVVEPDASSASEVLFTLLDKQHVDVEVAKAIYTGIIHDSGVLQYSCAKKRTFQIVGELMDYNFNTSAIIDETFYQKTYTQNQIMGRALLESIMFMDGKCISACVDRKLLKFYEADTKDLEGIVSQLRVTKGVEVAIFMYEIASQQYKVSMRSNGKVNVAEVASLFGGGGHVLAAGCTMNGTYYDVLNNLSSQIEKQLQ